MTLRRMHATAMTAVGAALLGAVVACSPASDAAPSNSSISVARWMRLRTGRSGIDSDTIVERVPSSQVLVEPTGRLETRQDLGDARDTVPPSRVEVASELYRAEAPRAKPGRTHKTSSPQPTNKPGSPMPAMTAFSPA